MTKRKLAAEPTHFQNIDLEIGSKRSLVPLIAELGAKAPNVSVMYVGSFGGLARAHYEVNLNTTSADKIARALVRLVKGLSAPAMKAWRDAKVRDFNIGIQSSDVPISFELPLAAKTVAIGALGARIVITVYTHGTTLPASGAWRVDYRVGNNVSMAGFDFLIAAPFGTGPATPYLNRSQGIVSDYVNWAGRAFGTFVTVASGNTDAGVVNGARLKNGMVVGAYSYLSYLDQSSHRRTTGIDGVHGSAFVNDATVDAALERPHILGPGFHQPSASGLHLPAIDVGVGQWDMRTADYSGPPNQIFGTSFAAPALLGAAILAHQYEGWFSALAFPMVNKAVLLASTVDANNDGNIGKGWVWFPQGSDAEDGAGQVSFFNVKRILDSNTYTYFDLSDSNFSSCGTNCREFIAASVSIPGNSSFRAAMAWQSCLTSETGTPTLNNDFDLVLSCGSPFIICGGTIASSSITSEIEMVSKAACAAPKSCSLRVRIKNGASLAACGSTTTERVGLAWRL